MSVYDKYLIKEVIPTDKYSNHQRVYRFENGYGASVIKGNYTYGGPTLWELAVLKFDDGLDRFDITYTTKITDDVIGNLTLREVDDVLTKIIKLKGDL